MGVLRLLIAKEIHGLDIVLQILGAIGAVFDPALSQETVELILGVEAKYLTQLGHGDPVIAEGLKRSLFQQGARRILSGREYPLGELVRDFDDYLHQFRVHPACLSGAR